MKILYYIYQICIALPILLVLTILTAIVTIIGSLVGGAHFWGYYPGKIWVGIASQCPQKGECTSLFEEVSLQQTAVSDFRMGE